MAEAETANQVTVVIQEPRELKSRALSPMELAWQRFIRMPTAWAGVVILIMLALIGIYAPLLVSEYAIWWQESGRAGYSPLFWALFNRNAFGSPHDLFFNLLMFELPLFVVLWFALAFLNRGTRLAIFLGLAVGIWLACMVPVIPSGSGSWHAVWAEREISPHTVRHETLPSQAAMRVMRAEEQVAAGEVRVQVARDALVLEEAIYADIDLSQLTAMDQVRAERDIRRARREVDRAIFALQAARDLMADEQARSAELATRVPSVTFPVVPAHPHINYSRANLAAPGDLNVDTGSVFWLGSTDGGHDVMARMVYGTRLSLTIGVVATSISMLIGIFIGGVSGYFGRWVDILLQRVVEIMLAFPVLVLILLVVAVVGRDIWIIIVVLGLTGWAGTARLVRGEFLAQAGRDYVLACEALGLPRWRIMFIHILPNILTPLIISFTFSVAGMVLAEATLAFIGLGDADSSSWGYLLSIGRENPQAPWLVWVPGLAIFLLVSALNLIGNAAREALDPRGVT